MLSSLCGSPSSSISSMGSFDLLAVNSKRRKGTHDPAERSSQDTDYSCDTAITDMAAISPDNKAKAMLSEASEPAASLALAPSRLPPPRPPRHHLRPSSKQTTIENPTVSKRTWPLPPYCYDPFAEFDEPSLSLELTDSHSRADSIEIDPGLFNRQDLQRRGSLAQQTIVEEEPVACLTIASDSNHRCTPVRQAFDLPLVNAEARQAQIAITSQPCLTSSTLAASATSRGSEPSADGRQAKPGKRVLGVGSSEARAIIGLSIRKRLSSKGSTRSAVANCVPTQDEENKKLFPKPFCKLPREMAIIGRDHKQAEARRHLELPAYHRGLRKQIYPPRVRYTSQSNSSSLFSGQYPHMRSLSEERDRTYTPRVAFDHVRTSSLR